MRQLCVARLVAMALLCLALCAPVASADNQVRSSKNADGSTKWEAIDSDSPEAYAAAPARPMTAAPASAVRSSHTTASTRRGSAGHGGGGAVTVHKNRDGSVEAFCSGPSGVIPAGGFPSDDYGSTGDGGFASSEGSSVGTSNAGGGVSLKRNADGSIETSSSGPSGSWGQSSAVRHHVAHKAAHRHTAVSHGKVHHSSADGHHR